jgi:hypothetical protein
LASDFVSLPRLSALAYRPLRPVTTANAAGRMAGRFSSDFVFI